MSVTDLCRPIEPRLPTAILAGPLDRLDQPERPQKCIEPQQPTRRHAWLAAHSLRTRHHDARGTQCLLEIMRRQADLALQ